MIEKENIIIIKLPGFNVFYCCLENPSIPRLYRDLMILRGAELMDQNNYAHKKYNYLPKKDDVVNFIWQSKCYWNRNFKNSLGAPRWLSGLSHCLQLRS